jgi:probable HAF family extracellular repeat protein
MKPRKLGLPFSVFFVICVVSLTAFTQQLQRLPDLQIPLGPPKRDQKQLRVPSSLREIANGSRRATVQSYANRDSRQSFADGTAELKRRQEERGEVVRPESTTNTIPYWSDSFSYQGLEFKYKMVGTDPKKGSKTTVIPTEIIPLRFVFPDGQVFDASTDIVDGQTAIQGIINSPIFQNYDFVIGGTEVGNTQFGDAFQRANFWDSVSTRGRNYHVLLGQPTVLPTQTIIVPPGMGSYFYNPFLNYTFPLVNEEFLDSQERSIRSNLHVSPGSLPITVWGLVGSDRGAAGWHGAQAVNGGLVAYIGTGYTPLASGFPDVYTLSHEIVEWMDDPFIDNYTPGWNLPFIESDRCLSGSIVRGLLEVADPVAFFLEARVTLPGTSFDYHVTEAMFIDFFTRSTRSRSVNDQYSMFTIGAPFGLPSEPSSECVGSVQADEHLIDVPGSVRTVALGINNQNDVVGYYLDHQNRIRGFIWKNGTFRAFDFPGALLTVASRINDSGNVVGYFVDGTGYPHGFAYINGQWQRIDFPGSTDTIAWGINSAGDIVGVYDSTQPITHGFILRNGQFTRVDTPIAQQSELRGINDAGQYVGSTWNDPFNGPYLGFIGGSSSFSPLNMPSALFTLPNSLNSSGMATGNFINGDDGYSSGFIRLFGNFHEVNADGVVAYVYGNNDFNQIVGQQFDFNTRRWVGYIGDLPLTK